MPACMSCWRSLDCFSAVLGMKGLAAAWPMRSTTGMTPWGAELGSSRSSKRPRPSPPPPPRGAGTPPPPPARLPACRRSATGSRRKTMPDSEYASSAAVANRRMTKSISCVMRTSRRSHLHRHDPPDEIQPQTLKEDRRAHQVVALVRVQQHAGVLTVEQVQDQEKDERQRHQAV